LCYSGDGLFNFTLQAAVLMRLCGYSFSWFEGLFSFFFFLLWGTGFCAQLPLELYAEQCFLVLVDAAERWLVVLVVTSRAGGNFIY